jgi:hypothetical protein
MFQVIGKSAQNDQTIRPGFAFLPYSLEIGVES